MTKEDWRALQIPLVILVLVLVIASLPVFFTNQLRDKSHQKLLAQEAALEQAKIRYQKSDDEKVIIIQNLSAFQALQNQGFIAPEPRLNWLDALRTLNQQLRLFGIQYQLGAQQPYTGPPSIPTGQLQLNQSLMRLNLMLLHEDDLLRFFNELNARQVGFFNVRSCTLARLQSAGVIRYQPNLQAECDLAWLTVSDGRLPSAP